MLWRGFRARPIRLPSCCPAAAGAGARGLNRCAVNIAFCPVRVLLDRLYRWTELSAARHSGPGIVFAPRRRCHARRPRWPISNGWRFSKTRNCRSLTARLWYRTTICGTRWLAWMPRAPARHYPVRSVAEVAPRRGEIPRSAFARWTDSSAASFVPSQNRTFGTSCVELALVRGGYLGQVAACHRSRSRQSAGRGRDPEGRDDDVGQRRARRLLQPARAGLSTGDFPAYAGHPQESLD